MIVGSSVWSDERKRRAMKPAPPAKGNPSDKDYNWTRPYSAFLALQAAVHVIFWFYWVVFLAKDGHKASSTLMAIALINNYIINCIWYNYYKDRILAEDADYRAYKL